MERKRPMEEQNGDQADLSPNDLEGVQLADRVRNTLDPRSIPRDKLAEDGFSGDEPVEAYLQRQKRE